MGGAREILRAKTKKELEQMVREWVRARREADWDIRAGWDPSAVEEAEDGMWEIMVSAHT